jgi:hypothetical protein
MIHKKIHSNIQNYFKIRTKNYRFSIMLKYLVIFSPSRVKIKPKIMNWWLFKHILRSNWSRAIASLGEKKL